LSKFTSCHIALWCFLLPICTYWRASPASLFSY